MGLLYSYSYLYYLAGAMQIICIIHAIRTGRREWMYLLIFLPGIGAIIYFVQEILPGLRNRGLQQDIAQSFIPGKRIKDLERAVAIADTEANRLNLAREYARHGQYEKAIDLVRSCLTGIYANDAGMTLDLARYLFFNNEFEASVAQFEKALKLKNGRFDKPEDDLLYARALEGAGMPERAEAEYQKSVRVHHSMEGMYYYGLMLKKQGRTTEANEQFNKIIAEKDLHPPHVRRMNSQWVSGARREIIK